MQRARACVENFVVVTDAQTFPRRVPFLRRQMNGVEEQKHIERNTNYKGKHTATRSK